MFIVRYSEIGLKGNKTRRNMEKLLIENIISSLPEDSGLKYKKSDGRIYLYSDSPELMNILPDIFGVKSFSRANEYTFNTIEDIVTRCVENYYSYVKNKTFAVRVTRKGTHNFTSKDLEIAIGNKLYDNSSGVNLESPEAPIYIEVRDKNFYTFTEKMEGPGGLPLKSEGIAISLFSGGIDSPVATFMVMKRGMATDLLFCSLAHPSDTLYMLKAARNLLFRYSYGYNSNIYILDGTSLITGILRNPEQKYANLIFKKLLYSYAEGLCQENDYDAIVTGESIGQVSSQIPKNLKSLSYGINTPLFRPLIGFDKEETINYSKRKGLYMDESIGEFCSLFSKNPGINTAYRDLKPEVEKFPLKEILHEIIKIKKDEIDDYVNSINNSKSDTIPENSIIIDLRDNKDFDLWHVPGAINMPVSSIDSLAESGNPDKNYFFYCKKGLNSAYAASIMRSHGYNSFYSTEKDIKKMDAIKN
ncbi:thiamine biosynthesis protein ThiI [Ferroplasma acidiphilum]|uniref:tRNA sulfurtransferase n=1 Tax=Ferroplasma acidiphilum TaxID=74969 RepID=A0A1V0N695_9ARCH|nr:THUMP domain-containing protein [Ferroplasma acidiphilum]ARD85652.1 thiamine biosynthesis protein ThiI [Ferroplasma acidiphilum]